MRDVTSNRPCWHQLGVASKLGFCRGLTSHHAMVVSPSQSVHGFLRQRCTALYCATADPGHSHACRFDTPPPARPRCSPHRVPVEHDASFRSIVHAGRAELENPTQPPVGMAALSDPSIPPPSPVPLAPKHASMIAHLRPWKGSICTRQDAPGLRTVQVRVRGDASRVACVPGANAHTARIRCGRLRPPQRNVLLDPCSGGGGPVC